MKKVLLLLLVAGAAAYFYWPYHAAKRLEEAFRLADKDALERLVDFPAVRQSLKDQLKAKMNAEAIQAGRDGAPANGGHAKLASALLTGAVADKVIDSMVTAESIARILKLEGAVSSGTSMALHDKKWLTPTEFSARAEDGSRFKFRLSGTGGWRVVSIEPGEKLGKQAQLPH